MLRLRIFLFLGLTAIVLSAPTTTESFVEETTEELIFEAQTDAYYDDSTVSPITSKAPVKPKVTKKPATRSSVPNYTSSHKFGSKVINKLAKTTTESPANDASSTLPPKFYENFIKKMVEGLFDEKQTFSGLLNNGVKKLNENYKVCQDFVSMLKRAVGALEQVSLNNSNHNQRLQ